MAANHPQLGAALSNVAELNRVYLEHQRESLREVDVGSRAGEKIAKHAKKRTREKKPKKRKDKKREDDRKSKKRRREKDHTTKRPRKKSKSRSRKAREASSSSSTSSGSSGDSSDDGSDDDASRDSASKDASVREMRRDPAEEIEFGRVAVDTAERILARFPDVRGDLANILQSVDAGEAVSVAGVPDADLRASLTTLFHALGLRTLNAKSGTLWSSRTGAEATLPRLAPAFAMAGKTLEADEGLGTEKERGVDARDGRETTRARAEAVSFGSALRESAKPEDAGPDAATIASTVTASIGPSIGPSARPPPRVALGPAMPPRATLEAAAALAAEDAVGPAPPEIVREVELVGAEARVAAAARVLAAARGDGDAYDVLGVDPPDASGDGASAAALKRAFWKLSLSVHPDKCAHPDAAGAFDAVKKAHETLCDPTARSKVDAARDERAARAGFDSWLSEERAKARWRATRGEAAPGDEALLRPAGEDARTRGGREEWMMKLPEQRRPVAGGEPTGGGGGNAKAFARTTFVERDARTIADWTAAPSEAAEAEKRLLLAAREAMYAAPAEAAEAAEAKRLVEQLASVSRGKTLLEKHQEHEARAAKAARVAARAAEKEAKKKGSADAGDGDGTGWSYRPWNRETDLEAGRASTKALSAGELQEKAGGDLKGRFGSGATEGGGR